MKLKKKRPGRTAHVQNLATAAEFAENPQLPFKSNRRIVAGQLVRPEMVIGTLIVPTACELWRGISYVKHGTIGAPDDFQAALRPKWLRLIALAERAGAVKLVLVLTIHCSRSSLCHKSLREKRSFWVWTAA